MMGTLRFPAILRSGMAAFLRLLLTLLILLALLPRTPALAQIVREENTAMAPAPTNLSDAFYISQSVPSAMLTNGEYNVSVTMQNRGTTTWKSASGYVLGSQAPQDNGTWGLARVQLPVAILPDEEVTFNFRVRAPSVPGNYRFQWRMLQEGVRWFGDYTPELAITVRDPNNAAPWGQSVPAQMETGKPYSVSVTMYNNGDTTWNWAQQYTLMAQSPHNNTNWGFNRVPLPFDNVGPGQAVTFTFQVTAPTTPGSYPFQWGMQREGYGSFGPGTNVAMINVVAPPPLVNNAEVVGISVPARMQTQLNYNVAVTMRNNGTTTWTQGALYRLGSQNPHDNQIWGPGRIELTAAVAPGQQYTFNFQVKAPAPGEYRMQWGMVQDNVQWFGAAVDSPVVVSEDFSRVTFIHTDGLGSPVARTDGAGTVLSRTRYEPYGYVATGATPTIGFTGHVNDADTGLTYMQQRYYDPAAGRFLSIDPVTTDANTGGSFNRYNYANNNPYKFVDPDGRSAKLLRPLIKVLKNGGDVKDALKESKTEIVDSVMTLLDSTSSPIDKAAAIFDLVSPVSAKEAKAGGSMLQNALQGAIGENDTARTLGAAVAGRGVAVRTSDGKLTFVDIMKKDGTAVEVKTGNSQLTPNQRQFADDAANNRMVTPVGASAARAGLEPGVPIPAKFTEVRH